jgi:acyl carrier protein
MTNLSQTIIDETRQVIEQKGVSCPDITFDTLFLQDLPMDSLDLATLIVSLEINTGLDPFREGFKAFHNVGQLIELYESASA